MVMTIHVDIVSAEEAVFSGVAEFAVVPAEMGELGIYPRHTPLLTHIKPGSVRLKIPDRADEELIYVSGGLLEVQPSVITVLSDTAIRGKDLDEAKAQDAKQRAEEAMKNRSSAMDHAKAEALLSQAIAQLRAIDQLRKRGH